MAAKTSIAGALLPKIIGSDTEIGNVLIDQASQTKANGWRAAWTLLNAIDGIGNCYRHGAGMGPLTNVQDVGRKFLLDSGGCCYIDMEHFEMCTPEILRAKDFAAGWAAMLRLAQNALATANARLPEGQQLEATVNNSDGNGSSWGGHLSVLINRDLFDQLCVRPEFAPFGHLASFQISSIVFAGAGKVGVENHRNYAPFQISQRADFIEKLVGPQTTYSRPLINSRDEPLCADQPGRINDRARLHVIFYDSTLAPVATYLKAGALQLELAMLESGRASTRHHLKHPLRALIDWSHDPDLRARARLLDGRSVTAVEHQLAILDEVSAFVAAGHAADVVPGANDVIELWADTLYKLEQRDWTTLTGRLDWVARRLLVDSAVQRNAIGWRSAQAKHLDLLFSSLDPGKGLHWQMARDGLIEQVAEPSAIERAMHNPPEDTRAWTRTMLLRRAGAAGVDRIDWDRVRFRLPGGPHAFKTVLLDNPAGYTRAEAEDLFTANADIESLIGALGGRVDRWPEPAEALPGVPAGEHPPYLT